MTKRIPTGSAGLDRILFGGIPENSISVLMGAPGTGKTILAEEIAFTNGTAEAPALYLTTLSEPLEKFITHGQHYSFFDPAKVGVTVIYEDLASLIREKGVDRLPEIIIDLIAHIKPGLLFIDSFKAVNELLDPGREKRTILSEVANALSAYRCTSFLVGEYSESMMTQLPEFAIADVVLNLFKLTTNVRQERYLRVEKLRGSDSIAGMHYFAINSDGIQMYPRLLTPRLPPTYDATVERVNSGIDGLDNLIKQGFWRGSTTLLAGPSGSGKTVVGLHFVRQGVLDGEPTVFLGFQENPTQLARIMHNLGWDPKELLETGNFEIIYQSPVEMQLDMVAAELFHRIRQGKVQRVVIDALGDLERSSIDAQRFANFIYALTQWFAVENVTCIMTWELRELFEVHSVTEHECSNMSDNLILLGFTQEEEMERTIRVMKTRGSEHDPGLHLVRISDEGVTVTKKS
jgi:circadian clock protein KaiC